VITLCNYACRMLSGMCDRNAMHECGSTEVLKISPAASSSAPRSSLDLSIVALPFFPRGASRSRCGHLDSRNAGSKEAFVRRDSCSRRASSRRDILDRVIPAIARSGERATRERCAALNFMDCRSVKDGARIKSDGRKRLNQPWRCPTERR